MTGVANRCQQAVTTAVPRAWARGAVMGLGLTLAGMTAWAAEPTEKEMRTAVQAQFDNVNEASAETAEKCNNRDFNRGNGDPMLAMACIGQMLGGGGVTPDASRVKPMVVTMTTFRKIACEKAQGKPGYLCDYIMGFDTNATNNPAAPWTRPGATSQGRFVKQQGGRWLRLAE